MRRHVAKKTFIGLEDVRTYWIDVLSDWNNFLDDQTGQARNNAEFSLTGIWFYYEGLNSPAIKITDKQINALKKIISYFDSVKAMPPRMRKACGVDDQSIIDTMYYEEYWPGVEFLKDAFNIDVKAPTLSSIDNPSASPTSQIDSTRVLKNIILQDGYDLNDLLSAEVRTFEEYRDAESNYDLMPEGPVDSPDADPPGGDEGIGSENDPSSDPVEGI
ncbi:hypothetical protein SAMN05192553_104141 [Cyclobacterium xiamenense]|uniref:Uncharacterized protein n=1 Tax=Cyclobacterium xiamenense TaxID=1297121 RepID=A0A1H6Z0X2_9BACT|nr:hypothetical protein [Cyclobacterium xiamenense]SEJ47139.1 hypothetical protein SAMN05192553_104141 [Cyclobacterium xiamenense]